MSSTVETELARRKCRPCEGGVPAVTRPEAERLLAGLPGWNLNADATAIRRDWRVKDFLTAIDFFQRIARIAEAEDHHPDLHLSGYRNAAVELTTHAIRGLSENDFILAAKINQLPVELKR